MCIKKNSIVLFLFFVFSLFFSNSKIFAIDFSNPKEVYSIELAQETNVGSEKIYVSQSGDYYDLTSSGYILKYDIETQIWSTFAYPGSEIGQFNNASDFYEDSTGNIYITDQLNHRIQIYNIGTSQWSALGESGSELGQLNEPTVIAVDPQDNIYVTDYRNNRIQKYNIGTTSWERYPDFGQAYNITDLFIDSNGVEYWSSLSDQILVRDVGVTMYTIGSEGCNYETTPASDKLCNPKSVYSRDGMIYIGDIDENKRIQVYNIATKGWSSLATTGLVPNGLFRAKAMSFDVDGNIYISPNDPATKGLQKYSFSTSTWETMNKYGTGNGQFNQPYEIDIDSNGNIYVADANNNRIQKYNIDTLKWNSIGTQGTNPGQFKWPNGVAVDNEGNIYVADTNNNRVQKYDIGNDEWIIISTDETSCGVGEGEFCGPSDLAYDPNGYIYVSDMWNNRIQKYNIENDNWVIITPENGTDYGEELGKFNSPQGIDLDINGNIYVADTYNNRIQKYNVETNKWSIEFTDIEFNEPTGLYVDQNNNIYVTEYYNDNAPVVHQYNARTQKWSQLSPYIDDDYPNAFNMTGIIYDKYGYLYIVHSTTGKITKYFNYDTIQYITSGSGQVTMSSETLPEGITSSPVAAIPQDGYRFMSWSDGIKDNPRVDVGGPGDRNITAHFGPAQKEITTLSPSVLADEVTSYHISIASTNPAATPNFTFNTNYTFKAGDAEIVFPADTVVTSTEGGNLDLTQFATTENTDTVKATLTQALASVQVGIPNAKLTFSKPVTITIPVGASYNGQTLEIKYKREGEDTWNVEGTCVVASGNCTFDTTHATTFAALEPVTSSSNESNSSNATSVSVSSTPDHSCHSSKPLFTSDLFQINTTTNSAKIYFTPQADTNNYVISFSTNPNAEEHGEQVSLLREGVQSHSIYYLKPNTTYYVKVRGQNGCMPGEWSNIMKFKTNSTIYYKSGLTTFVSNVKSLVKNTVTKKTDTDTKTDDLKEDKTNISTDTSGNQTNNNTVETSSSPNQQTTEASKAKKCFLWWCW